MNRLSITINGTQTVQADEGTSLLDALKQHKFIIPSACGGRGLCGKCRLKVLTDCGALTPAELKKLSQDEIKNGFRLSCQVKIDKNIGIEIPREFSSLRMFSTEVVDIRDLTYDIKGIRLRLIEPDTISFKAGQYIQIDVPSAKHVTRAYSMASDPAVHNEIELQVRLVPNGIATTYIHTKLKVGDKLNITGPYGDFYMRNTPAEKILIAGGSGMAPIRSILFDMLRNRSNSKIYYFFGAKACKDLFLIDEMKALESKLPGFKFIPALSHPEPTDLWDGETGLITHVVVRRIARADNMEAYLCGSPIMIEACITILKEKGMKEENIFYDKFS